VGQAVAPGAAAGAHQSAEEPHRPRIGLVLSGGGARGAAHIGVLKVLDQMHVPIDAIAGTSMGAVVGGLYASGLSARQIESIMTSLNWQRAFRDRPYREDLPLRRKQEDENFLVKFPLGIRGGRVQLPKGLLQGQTLNQILRRLTLPVAEITSFDELPTPFRAVATDLETGDAVVMKSGDLTSAMRASLSAPAVFAPVERDGRVLVDGGVAQNLPIDVARSMGVDILIVVDVGSPLLSRQQLKSIAVISNQMFSILVSRTANEQLKHLQPADILIRPPLGDASSFDFGRVARFVGVGEAGARQVTERLAALAVSAQEFQRYADTRARARRAPPRIDFVQVQTGSEQYSERIASLFSDLTGKPLDPNAVGRRVITLYGEAGLDTLDYRVVQKDDKYGLALDARGNSMGPNYVRFGLNLQDDFEGVSSYNAALRFVVSEITHSGGEWVLDLQDGQTSLIGTEIFLPVSSFSGWFLMPHTALQAREVQVFAGQSELAEYRVRTFDYGLDLGRQFGNWGEIRVGSYKDEGHWLLDVGNPLLTVPRSENFGTRNYFARFSYDRLDDVNFPHYGQKASLQWTGARNVVGLENTFDQVTFNYLTAYSFGRDTLALSAEGGVTLERNASDINLLFPLGGFLNLSGLKADSLLGPNYSIVRTLLYRQIGRGGPNFLDVPTYLGISLEAGNVYQSCCNHMHFSNMHKDGSIFLGMDTFLGPVYLAIGYDDQGNHAFYLFLGRTFSSPQGPSISRIGGVN
jgi:NTE family protein